MSLSDEQWEFLKDVSKLILWAGLQGYKITGGELYRPELMQQHYFDTGKSKTMNSKHREKLAIDLNVFKPDGDGFEYTTKKEDVQAIGDYWEDLNDKNSWGGNWKSFLDVPHFQRKA